MPQYKAPLRDVRFLIRDVLDYEGHYAKLPNGGDATPDMVDSILEECAKFCENVVAPLYQSGDAEGCKLENGVVTTPKGFKRAYDLFVEGGWVGLSHPVEYGGQGMPMSLGVFKSEMLGSANWPFGMYPGLSLGAMNTLMLHATPEQKQTYMPPLTEGRWMGTMCLTEPQCGTDLGQVSTKAVPRDDGSYEITGTKIFISSGDHDLTENIVHIALARIPGSPPGTKGISLFIIPKFLPNADGSVGAFNKVVCSALEHKMGIKASSTCTIEFEGSVGFLLGPVNRGLEAMFTFMNTARIGTALQAICSTELSYQGALAYAKERRSMRALSGKKEPDQVADAIIHHGDVRRMLLTMKAVTEGGRAMLYHTAKMADFMSIAAEKGDEAERARWDDKIGFYTPILKGFLTELALECTSHGMQVFGGHGYIREHGMEQIARDTRIATMYEGTTSIQALDLLGRKVLIGSKGRVVVDYTAEIAKFCARHATDRKMLPIVAALGSVCAEWNLLTGRLLLGAARNREIVANAAYDYLMFSGYVMMAYFWAQMAAASHARLRGAKGVETPEFYRAKLMTAEFYFERILPRTKMHAASMTAPVSATSSMPIDHFAFV